MQWTFDDPEIVINFNNHIRRHLPWYDMMHDTVVHLIKNYLPRGGTVVDFGASTGNLTDKLLPLVKERFGEIHAVETSKEMRNYMALRFSKEIESTHVKVDSFSSLMNADIYVACLTLSFINPAKRQKVLKDMIDRARTAVIIVDKVETRSEYLSTVLRRLTTQMKLDAGVSAEEVVAKDLSLSGIQIPLDPYLLDLLDDDAKPFFRVGEFAGWIIEK
jgi:tRNA (cmo5U34)-methyltransferase